MGSSVSLVVLFLCAAAVLRAQQSSQAPATEPDDPIRTLVAALDLEKYKSTIKGLTQFGDRVEFWMALRLVTSTP